MTPLSQTAESQFDAVVAHYEHLQREDAINNLMLAVRSAQRDIFDNPLSGLPAPRPYPQLAAAGEKWIKRKAYWIHYTLVPLVVLGIYYETLNIPVHVYAAQPGRDPGTKPL